MAIITLDKSIMSRKDCPLNVDLKGNQLPLKIVGDGYEYFAILDIEIDRIHANYVWGNYARNIKDLEYFAAGIAHFLNKPFLSFRADHARATNFTAKRLGYIQEKGGDYIKSIKNFSELENVGRIK